MEVSKIILEKKFLLNQKLKCLCKVKIDHFLLVNGDSQDYHSKILITFYLKAMDLFCGIILLHRTNLDECAQALIRVLFETYLKYKFFLSSYDQNPENAAQQVLESMMIMKEKDAIAQDKSIAGSTNIIDSLGNINVIKNKYSPDAIKKIKQYGFPQLSIEELARKFGKSLEYDCMYRNYSRNVHANDTLEYLKKQNIAQNSEYSDLRNFTSFDFTFKLFFEMMIGMNFNLSLHFENHLKEIYDEYQALS